MKKVLFFAMFALLAICMMVGCSGETKVVDSAANFDVLTNAANAITPFSDEDCHSVLNVETTMTDVRGIYEEYVRSNGCVWKDTEVIKAEGKYKVTTNSDLTTTYTDVTLEVTEDINVYLSTTDFDGNPKTLTLTFSKGTTIKSEYEKNYMESVINLTNTIKGKINNVDSDIVYNVQYLFEEEICNGSAKVNGSEVKSSLLTQSLLSGLIDTYIRVEQSPI